MLSLLWIPLSFTLTKNVYLHLEKFNGQLHLLHTGVSFSNGWKTVRYDFRPFTSEGSYETSSRDRFDTRVLFPELALPQRVHDEFREHRGDMESKTILWGKTTKTWKEISDFELDVLCRKRYVIGVYDCRHYARDFTGWSCHRQTPVWDLDAVWNEA